LAISAKMAADFNHSLDELSELRQSLVAGPPPSGFAESTFEAEPSQTTGRISLPVASLQKETRIQCIRRFTALLNRCSTSRSDGL
jgi:hypothetical protein